jgi:cytochrome oxidase Cu insertion factor (SCO1/SenC/PrrC family)
MRITKIFLSVFLFLALLASASAEVKQTPSTANTTAQDFTLTDQDGKSWTLGEVLKNHRGVVLAFYPKDDTGL